jgi:hypothetical protein
MSEFVSSTSFSERPEAESPFRTVTLQPRLAPIIVEATQAREPRAQKRETCGQVTRDDFWHLLHAGGLDNGPLRAAPESDTARADLLATIERAREIIDVGFKRCAHRYHSDKGGSDIEMARTTRVRDFLLRRIACIATRRTA